VRASPRRGGVRQPAGQDARDDQVDAEGEASVLAGLKTRGQARADVGTAFRQGVERRERMGAAGLTRLCVQRLLLDDEAHDGIHRREHHPRGDRRFKPGLAQRTHGDLAQIQHIGARHEDAGKDPRAGPADRLARGRGERGHPLWCCLALPRPAARNRPAARFARVLPDSWAPAGFAARRGSQRCNLIKYLLNCLCRGGPGDGEPWVLQR